MTEVPDPRAGQAPLAELLRFVPFFAPLPAESTRCFDVLRDGRVEQHPAGAMLVRAGAEPELVVVLSGTAASATEAGATFGPGDHFGEIALLTGRDAPYSVTARDPTIVYRLGRSSFDRLLDACPRVVRRLLAELATRIHTDAEPRPSSAVAAPGVSS